MPPSPSRHDVQQAFSDAIRSFDNLALSRLLDAGNPWPTSPMDFPPWIWVVDNAISSLAASTGLTRLHTPAVIIKGLQGQMELLKQSNQDASLQEIVREKKAGGCVHRLICFGTVKETPNMAKLAQCILVGVPESALTIRNGDGYSARELLESMSTESPANMTYHNLPAIDQAWAAREASKRAQRSRPDDALPPLTARIRHRP